MLKKTYQQKPTQVSRRWHLLDAQSQPLGRLATKAAGLLIGKHKPTYSPHVDGGDYVIVTNARNLVVTGQKETTKTYYRHSGYPGNLRQKSLREQREVDPCKIINWAVRGMLPKNKLRPDRLARLKVYDGPDHPHQGQLETKS